MKRKVFVFLMCLVLLMAMPITASADMGPKPSVRIEFTGIQGEDYYGTLLSLRDSTGPASAWNGNPDYANYHPGEDGYDIWLKFVEDGPCRCLWPWPQRCPPSGVRGCRLAPALPRHRRL